MDEDDEPTIENENYANLISLVGQAPIAVAMHNSLSPQRVFPMSESKKRERGLTVSSTGSKEGQPEAPHSVRSPSAYHYVFPHLC